MNNYFLVAVNWAGIVPALLPVSAASLPTPSVSVYHSADASSSADGNSGRMVNGSGAVSRPDDIYVKAEVESPPGPPERRLDAVVVSRPNGRQSTDHRKCNVDETANCNLSCWTTQTSPAGQCEANGAGNNQNVC